MRIVVSKAYLKWKKANKSERAADVIDKFMCRVFNAADITNVAPQPKSAGTNLRKMPGVVDEFTLNWQYRVYAKCVELTPGQVSFCLAGVGVKGNTNQNEDILSALSIFDKVSDVEWVEWQPSADQIVADVANDMAPVDDAAAPVVPAIKKQSAKKKGKPLDENGLTVAERKALRRQQEQEEQKKRQAEAQRAKQLAAQNAAPVAAAPVADAPSVTDNVAGDGVRAVRPEPKTDAAPNDADVAQPEPKTDAASNDADVAQPEPKNAEPKNAEPKNAEPKNAVPEFQDFADVQYQLEMLEYQMTIEKLKIKMAQHEIALIELAMRKLQLLQMQKKKDLQK